MMEPVPGSSGRERNGASREVPAPESETAQFDSAPDPPAPAHANGEPRVEARCGEPWLQEMLETVMAVLSAEKGVLQLFEGNALRVVAHRGHDLAFLDGFGAAEDVLCSYSGGEAMPAGERVVVPDVETYPSLAGTAKLEAFRAAGVRAVCSTPLRSRHGRLLGRVATHWGAPYAPDNRTLSLLDRLARQTADFIEQKQEGAALRAREEQIRTLVANCRDVIYRLNLQTGRFEYVSPSALQVIGLSAAEIQRMNVRTLHERVHPDDLPALQAALTRLPVSRRENLEYRLQLPSGEYRWLSNHTGLVCDATGRVIYRYGNIRDITERKRVENALRASDVKYRALFHNQLNGLVHCKLVFDSDGRAIDYRFLDVNDTFLERTGLSRARVVGSTGREALPGTDPSQFIGVCTKVAVTGNAARFELYREFRERWYSLFVISPQRDEFIAIFVDITEAKRAEEARRTSEARLRLLSRTADRLLNSDNPIEVIQQACEQILDHLGWDVFFNFVVDERAGKLRLNACSGIPPEEAQRIEWLEFGDAICGAVAQTRKRVIAEDILRSVDPRAALVRSYAVQAYCCHPLITGEHLLGTLSFGTKKRPTFSAGEIALMRTVAHQFAVAIERKRSKLALREANAQLVEADQRKNDFLAVLSHELRNPLAAVTTSLHVLEHAPPSGEQVRRARQILRRQVTQLSNLVNDLLDLTRISRGKINLHTEPLELNETVRQAVEDHRSRFDQVGVRLELSNAPGAVSVEADATRIAQIVSNLLQNAAKFTLRGGVTRASVDIEGDQAVVHVRDDGVGIAEENLARMFQPFMQADQTLDRSKGGLGLGLALVKGLVELHGGSVSAHSEGVGKGTSITVKLPLSRGAPPEHAAEPRPSPAPRRRVLIIEDNVDAADALRTCLELSEHEVEVAYTGPEGLAKACVFRPEVVLCDIGLPGMDGYDVALAFRADESLRTVCLVALSGYALAEDVQRAIDAGFDQHIAKPPNLEEVEEVLNTLRPKRLAIATEKDEA